MNSLSATAFCAQALRQQIDDFQFPIAQFPHNSPRLQFWGAKIRAFSSSSMGELTRCSGMFL
jgi:hypothetical protein